MRLLLLASLLNSPAPADEKPRSGDPIDGRGRWIDPGEHCTVEPAEERLRIVVLARATTCLERAAIERDGKVLSHISTTSSATATSTETTAACNCRIATPTFARSAAETNR